MSDYDNKKIELYQETLRKDPTSRAFAPLVEAYRKMGLLPEARELAEKGLRHNPELITGLVAYGRLLIDLEDYTAAAHHLLKAHHLSSNNLMAIRLLAFCHDKLKHHKKALRLHKKLLFLVPNDPKALKYLKNWEFIESPAYQSFENYLEAGDADEMADSLQSPELATSLIDSVVNLDKLRLARELAYACLNRWPGSDQLASRLDMLLKSRDIPAGEGEALRRQQKRQKLFKQKRILKRWLQRIEHRKVVDP